MAGLTDPDGPVEITERTSRSSPRRWASIWWWTGATSRCPSRWTRYLPWCRWPEPIEGARPRAHDRGSPCATVCEAPRLGVRLAPLKRGARPPPHRCVRPTDRAPGRRRRWRCIRLRPPRRAGRLAPRVLRCCAQRAAPAPSIPADAVQPSSFLAADEAAPGGSSPTPSPSPRSRRPHVRSAWAAPPLLFEAFSTPVPPPPPRAAREPSLAELLAQAIAEIQAEERGAALP